MDLAQRSIQLFSRRIFPDDFRIQTISYKSIEEIQAQNTNTHQRHTFGKIIHDVLTHEISDDLKNEFITQLSQPLFNNTPTYIEMSQIVNARVNTPDGNLNTLKLLVNYLRNKQSEKDGAGAGAGPQGLKVDLDALFVDQPFGQVQPGKRQKRKLGMKPSRKLGMKPSRKMGMPTSRKLGMPPSRKMGMKPSRKMGMPPSRKRRYTRML
jgi:hypothetical protein